MYGHPNTMTFVKAAFFLILFFSFLAPPPRTVILRAGVVEQSDPPLPASGSSSCRECHRDIYDSYLKTAHYKTMREADADSIKGRFLAAHNVLKTADENTYYVMEKKQDGFYQTGFGNTGSTVKTRTERFDLVVGSGRKGQSYLFWKQGLLFQLPVSYVAGSNEWI